MKFEDVKVGQVLEDVYGNRFKVLNIMHDNKYFPILVKCVEFKKSVKVDMYSFLTGFNQTLWILKDRSLMLSVDNGLGKFVKDNFYPDSELLKSLEQIIIDVAGIKRHYLLGQQSTVDSIELTLSEMDVIEYDYLTSSNVKVGMKVIDGVGNEYVVIDFNTEAVKLSNNTKFTSMDGMSKNIVATVRVPYYNDGVSEDACTTKDFQIVREN